MENKLHKWLFDQFTKSNIRKYHKYFDEWVSGITNDQICGFKEQMIGMETGSKYINKIGAEN